MTKLLNLDELSPKEKREVQIGDKTFEIMPMSVEDFIVTDKIAREMENETSYAKQLEATVSLIQRAIPSMTEVDIRKLSLEKMQALTAFVRGVDVATIMKNAEDQAAAEKAEVEGKPVVPN